MRFTVVVVGRPRDSALSEAIGDYEGRAARYWPLEVHEVREERGKLGPVEIVQREGERLMERVPVGSTLVACDAEGDAFTSREFANWMQRQREAAQDTTFVIGGAHGLPSALKERSARRLALARWTLPHEIARLVLAEQLYRAGTIVRGEPYDK